MKDPYQVLGVAKNASQDDIKNAYRKLAKKFHPDLNPGNKEREAQFKDIAQAYELIGSEEARGKFDRGETEEQQRAQYEQYQQQQRARPSYYDTQQEGGRYSQSFGEGDDFFENLFRGAGGAGARRGRSMDFPGEDQLYRMDVDFREAALGAEREITLPQGKKLQVKIPAGIETGKRLRFKGQGGPGFGKGAPGDALVEIHVLPLEGFGRNGKDIETELPISFLEALLGAEIAAPTLEGPVALKVPSGVSTGSKLRIRGKGAGAGAERGDQIVTLKVVMPKKVDPALQEAAREWAGRFGYNPREVR